MSTQAKKPRALKQQWARSERELATALGVSARTVKGWRLVEGAPIADGSGRYNIREWMRWASKHGKDTPATGASSKHEWEIERIKRQVERLDFELKREKGEFVAVEDVKRWAAEMVYAFRTEILALPGKLAPRIVGLSPVEAELQLRQAVSDALMRLHREPWKKESPSGAATEGAPATQKPVAL